ncbi:hypothetical protein DFJ67_0317 [Asanoa ferruginea]|uniref:MYXO-CTERM domain-containing protein n=1 Tax=Asanoa ferruginea TaxID=53367 RepID=A0A3D9ZAG2_9ACTN|nr:hypothetical protein [Asanoa ferruginea]REF94398.1 hypothetical protein DFJ67_0317 [Asanoa ferruginea]GIF51084.1 hypothetical protein Afe04nite_56230 [Asanoa ferruginea]
MSVVSFAALSRIVVVGAAAAAGTVLIAGAPARASGAWIELSPSTVQAGEGVAIKASCDDNLKQDEAKPGGGSAPDQASGGAPDQTQGGKPDDQAGHKPPEAKVTSKAFGEVPLISQWGFLVGDAIVPSDTREGDYDVKLSCANGKNASTKLHVIGNVRPTHGPHTGGGGLAGDSGSGMVTLAGGLAAVGASAGLAVALRRRRRLV